MLIRITACADSSGIGNVPERFSSSRQEGDTHIFDKMSDQGPLSSNKARVLLVQAQLGMPFY